MTFTLIDPSAFCVMAGVGIGISSAPLAGISTAAAGLLGSSTGWSSEAGTLIGTASPGFGVTLVVLAETDAGGGASVVVVCGRVVVVGGLVVVVGGLVVVGLSSKT